jgi:hypothetical protein
MPKCQSKRFAPLVLITGLIACVADPPTPPTEEELATRLNAAPFTSESFIGRHADIPFVLPGSSHVAVHP